MLRITDKYELQNVLFVLAAAMDPKEKRGNAALKCVLIENGKIVCTDGHRLHLADTEQPAGMYDIVKKTRSEVVLAPSTFERPQFPEYSRCIPSLDGVEALEVELGEPCYKIYTRYARAAAEQVTINYDYFCEAAQRVERIYIMGAFDPVTFTGNGTKAIVMPCKM